MERDAPKQPPNKIRQLRDTLIEQLQELLNEAKTATMTDRALVLERAANAYAAIEEAQARAIAIRQQVPPPPRSNDF